MSDEATKMLWFIFKKRLNSHRSLKPLPKPGCQHTPTWGHVIESSSGFRRLFSFTESYSVRLFFKALWRSQRCLSASTGVGPTQHFSTRVYGCRLPYDRRCGFCYHQISRGRILPLSSWNYVDRVFQLLRPSVSTRLMAMSWNYST